MIGILAALAAAAAYGGATILQAVGVRRLAAGGPWLRAGWPYAVGLLLDLGGFAVSVVALRTLPLFLVESAVASSVAITAVLSVAFLGVRLSRAEVSALVVVLAGLVALAGAAEPGAAARVPSATTLTLALGVLVVAAVVGLGWAIRTSASAALLSVGAGLGFGGVGIAARVLADLNLSVIGTPRLWALVAFGLLGTVGYALGLERGRVTTVAAITFATETVVPSAVGLVWLHDSVRPGLAWLAVLGFAATLGACVRLARLAEVEAPPSAPARETDLHA